MNTRAVEYQKDLQRDLFIIQNSTHGVKTDVLELQKLLNIVKDIINNRRYKNKIQDVEDEKINICKIPI